MRKLRSVTEVAVATRTCALRWSVRHRSAREPLGRFGGGWQWKLGVQASEIPARRGTIIVSLLVLDVRVDWRTS